MSEFTEYALPSGWQWVAVKDITSYVQRGKSPKYADSSAMPVVNQKCVRWDGVQPQHLKFIDPSQWHAWAPERTLQDGDILWNSTGTGTIGRAAIYRPLAGFPRVVADSHVTIVRVKDGPPEYLHYWIRSPLVQSRIDAMQTGSTNQVELGRGEILSTRIPLAPPNERHRIVAKLDALQTRSRRAREALDAVPPLLEKLRQSVLAAAFRGDLTKDWRAKNKDVEPASKLLERIRAERRKKWEESELAKLKAKGKPPADDKWRAKYKEPEPIDATGLPELPNGWCWANVEELASDEPRSIQSGPFGSNLLHSEFTDTGVLAIGIDNVQDGVFSMGSEHRISEEKFEELRKYAARPGDVLVTVMATVGRCCSVPDGLETAIITKHVYRVSPDKSLVLPDYLMHSMRGAPALRDAMKADVRGQTRPGINGEVIRALPVPVAPLEEQRAVLASLGTALARLAELRRHRESTARQVGELDRALLAKAFRGELVPQDPDDDPAEAIPARPRRTNGPDARETSRRGARSRSQHATEAE